MEKKALLQELKFIFIRSIFLNIAAYLISVIFLGFTLPMAVGLVLGTLGLLLNIFLLNRSIYMVVQSGGEKAKAKIMMWYIIRMIIMSCILIAAMLWNTTCMIAAAIPYIYPQLVYGGKRIFRKEGKAE